MPFSYNFKYTLNQLNDENTTLTKFHNYKFNFIEAQTQVRTLTLASTQFYPANASIVVRNSSTSSFPVNIEGNGVTIDVSDELGPSIPAGGICELKRLGASDVWSMYGYIEDSLPEPVTIALTHMDGTNGQTSVNDEISGTWDCVGCSLTTSNPEYGDAALQMPSATPVECEWSETLNFGTGDYTIEFSIFAANYNNGVIKAVLNWGNYVFSIRGDGGILIWNGSIDAIIGAAGVLIPNQYNKFAIVRTANITTLYINGVVVGNTGAMGADLTGASIQFGSNATHDALECDIDEVRLSDNARYYADYTPATGPFTE